MNDGDVQGCRFCALGFMAGFAEDPPSREAVMAREHYPLHLQAISAACNDFVRP